MVELRVLGTLQLRASDRRPVESLTHQARRAALLAYLAAAVPRGAHRRDKLLALFWPALDQAHARGALNQALHVLRATLGEDAVVPKGNGALGLTDSVWCDAAAFETALDAGRSAEALALYGGDLLDGFFITGAPEFERWLERERERLRRRASDGAWALAEAKAMDGDAVEAVRWARWAANLTPSDEAAARRLMTLLHVLGDRAAAIHAYETFSTRLRQEYEVEPSAETQALAASIREEEEDAAVPALVAHPKDVRAPSRAAVPVAGPGRPDTVGRVTAAAVAIAAVVGGAWLWLRAPTRGPAPLARFTLAMPGDHRIALATPGSPIALSPDGSQLVYLAKGPRGTELFLRSLDRVEAVPLPGTLGAHQPFFSPDGEWLGFVAEGRIRKVRLDGGPAITVSTVGIHVTGASWGPDDVIVFATPAGLWQVPAGGGDPRLVAASDIRGPSYRWPAVLPDGGAAVFTKVDRARHQLTAVSLETGALQSLGLEGTNPLFVAPGYLVFARSDGALIAAPFDPGARRITGAGFPVAGGVQVGVSGAAKVAVSHSGVLVYVTELSSDLSLAIVDRAGAAETLPVTPRAFIAARASPDGRRIATAVGTEPDIWVLDRDAMTFRRLTFDGGSMAPVWSPDGNRIAFATGRAGGTLAWAIRSILTNGADSAESVHTSASGQVPTGFTPDGRALLLQGRHIVSGLDVWVLRLGGDSRPQPLLRGPPDEHSPSVSPDGRWLAYVSNEAGHEEVYVRPFLLPGNPVQVSRGGGREPRWAASGRELFYRSGQGMVAVAITTSSPSLRLGRPTVLFDDKPYLTHDYGAAYDVQPDGRFLMVRRGSESWEVVVLLNWLNQLRR